MKCREFVDKYNLHDSLLEQVEYDENSTSVCLTVDFCYWQQNDYSDEMPETGIIKILFSGINEFKYTPYCLNSDEIVDVNFNADDEFMLKTYNDINDTYHTIYIKASEVEVINVR